MNPPACSRAPAEEVGLEPTNRFLDGYSLANCWLTIRRTPPNNFILRLKITGVNISNNYTYV